MSYYLYFIKCESNPTHFLYYSIEKPEHIILLECRLIYPYLRVVECIDKKLIVDKYDIDKHVKVCMLFYGIDNVRGGSYSDKVLPEYKLNALKNENEYIKSVSQVNTKSLIYDKIINYYLNNPVLDIENEKERIIYELKEYEKTKDLYNKCNFLSFEYINWLNEFLNCGYDKDMSQKVSKHALDKYKNTLQYLKRVTKTFFMLRDLGNYGDYHFESTIFLKNPEFVFDIIFYHRKSIKNWESIHTSCDKLIKQFDYMSHFIKIKSDELKFDLSSHPEFPVLYYEMSLQILSNPLYLSIEISKIYKPVIESPSVVNSELFDE